jgi:hypothetical protein
LAISREVSDVLSSAHEIARSEQARTVEIDRHRAGRERCGRSRFRPAAS